jgi:putative transposase
MSRLSASSSTGRWCACGSTDKRHRFPCWSRWASGRTARRCCWRSRTWAESFDKLRSEAAWRALLDDLVKHGLKTPELAIVDGAPGLEKALAALWNNVPVQRCTVHKHRNLLAHAPDRLHEEISADYKDMIYAETKQEIEAKRKAFIRKWRLKCRAVADSLEEAGDKLFTFTRFPKSQWKSIRTSNAIERLHEEFKRRIKTQTVLPSAETAAMLFWALLASGQITMRKVDGWRSLNESPSDQTIDLAA